jgi:hypothetical protein
MVYRVPVNIAMPERLDSSNIIRTKHKGDVLAPGEKRVEEQKKGYQDFTMS